MIFYRGLLVLNRINDTQVGHEHVYVQPKVLMERQGKDVGRVVSRGSSSLRT